MDRTQLYRLYQQETMHHVNPPSFQTWLDSRNNERADFADAQRGTCCDDFLHERIQHERKGK